MSSSFSELLVVVPAASLLICRGLANRLDAFISYQERIRDGYRATGGYVVYAQRFGIRIWWVYQGHVRNAYRAI